MFAVQLLDSHNSASSRSKEAIHSGQFMVSQFEAEEQDDEDEVAVPIPEVPETKAELALEEKKLMLRDVPNKALRNTAQQQLAIDTSLSKLFQCMSLAYRQKLTSPKWNRFRGIRLRWKDKIRLNNVIWRCWHMQFIKKKNTLICQFASPLDVDTHNKPEAIVLEGKYWKRKLAAVTAEYKKWRMFYRNHISGHTPKETSEMLNDMYMLNWNSQSSDGMHMMVDEDYMVLMTDTLFSTITNQPFPFPDSREIAKAGLADFIQPSLGPLQPNLDDYMDTFEPLQDFIAGKLPTVPEEQANDYKTSNQPWLYPDLDLFPSTTQQIAQIQQNTTQMMDQFSSSQVQQQQQQQQQPQQSVVPVNKTQIQDTRQMMVSSSYNSNMMIQGPETFQRQQQQQQQQQQQAQQQSQPPSYQSSVIAKNVKHASVKMQQQQQAQTKMMYEKPMEHVYHSYQTPLQEMNSGVQEDPLRISEQPQPLVQQSQEMELSGFKLPQTSESTHASQGYKFSPPASMSKFTSQTDDRVRLRASARGRQRSRSTTREPLKRPPLISAVSDPQLVPPSGSVLLTQLLTNSPDASSVFNRNQQMSVVHDQRQNQIKVKEESSPIPILPQPTPPTTTLIITTPLNTVQSSSSDPLFLSSLSTSSSPVLDTSSQGGLNSPTSSQSSLGSPNRDAPLRDHRRVGHIHAEQKRRYNIKNGFDMIHSLIPHLHQNPNAKLSKAAMLQKGAEYIRQLRSERNQLKEEMDNLRQQIESLNTSISNCQSLLPATGAPVSRRQDNKMQEMFDEYVRTRTMENWKFWIFSLLFKPLLVSFNNFVSTSNLAELYRSTMLWVEQHCTLVDLRPVVLNSLRYLCTKTDILADPEKLPEEARAAVLSSSSQNQL